MDRL
jgi:hypothetical protein